MSKIITYEDFMSNYTINENISIIGQYKNMTTPVLCKCKIDGYEWMKTPRKLSLGYGCPVCASKVVMKGINDIETTNPELFKLLHNKDDAYKYTQYSGKKIDFDCPNCGSIINKEISEVAMHGLKCKNCSDGFPYDEKFMCNLLDEINVDYIYQFKPKFVGGRIYDFLLKDFDLIVELDGGLGHGKRLHNSSKETLQDTIDVDIFKTNSAIENGYKIIRIDTDYPSESKKIEFIKNAVITSELSSYFDFSKIDLDKISEKSCNSLLVESCNLFNDGFSTREISTKLHINIVTVINYLKNGRDIGLCNYISKIEKNNRKVKCITTNEIFSNSQEASKKYNVDAKQIRKVCEGKALSCGKINNMKLIWKYA